MLFGIGLAFFIGKPLIKPMAPHLPAIPLGFWSSVSQVRSALEVNVLFVVGLVLCPAFVCCGARAGAWSFARWARAPMPRAPWATT